jgi:tetratricopeptide (TPR) repeat protein
VRCYGKETARIAVALATHFERGRDFPRAIEYLTQAADVAVSRYASEAAEEYCSRALTLTEKLSEEQRTGAELALLYKRGRNRQTVYRTTEAASDFTTMLHRAQARGDAVQQCMALIALAFNTWGTHQIAETSDRAKEALRIAEQLGHQGLRAISMMFLGSGHVWVGDLEAAKPILDESVALARQANDPQALLAAAFMRGAVNFFQSEYQPAERIFREALDLGSILRDGFLYPMSQLSWNKRGSRLCGTGIWPLWGVSPIASPGSIRNYRISKRRPV